MPINKVTQICKITCADNMFYLKTSKVAWTKRVKEPSMLNYSQIMCFSFTLHVIQAVYL